jgi:cytochrome P450
MTGTSAMFDLLSADPKMGYWEKIIEEAGTEYRTDADWLEARTGSKLPYLDSAFRETLRRNPMNIRGISREIISKDGLTLPSGGHLPQGTWVTTALDSVHNDERFYPNPEEYQPFRFVTHYESTPTPQAGNTASFTTANDKFLAFGYGRHGW